MPLAAAGVIAAGSLAGAWIGSNAASKASDAQIQMQQKNLAFQQQMYDQAVGRAAPVTGLGNNAAGLLSSIYGFGGSGGGTPGSSPGMNWDAFINTPDYQFAYDQGNRALQSNMAAKHLLNSGGMVREAVNYGQGMAGQQFGNTVQRLLSMIGMGNQANAGINGVGFGGNVGQSYTQMGNAAAGGITGAANPWISALNSGPGNALGAYKYFGGDMNGGGGGSSGFASSSYAGPQFAGLPGNPFAGPFNPSAGMGMA